MDEENQPEPEPTSPPVHRPGSQRPARPKPPKLKKDHHRRRWRASHPPGPQHGTALPPASATSTDAGKQPSPALPSAKPAEMASDDAIKADAAESPTKTSLDGDLKSTGEADDSSTALHPMVPRKHLPPRAVRDDEATDVPSVRTPRKIARIPRDSLENIRPSGKGHSDADSRGRNAPASSPPFKQEHRLRFDGSEDGTVEHVQGGTMRLPSRTADDRLQGQRRKSSVRFGQATYREIEYQSDTNIDPVPKQFATTLTVFMVVCMCVILFMIYAFTPPARSKLVEGCSTTACYDAITYITNVTDQRVQPCLDFYGHVCGRWTADSDAEVGFVRDGLVSLWSAANKTLLQPEDLARDRHGAHILQSFYKACYNFMQTRSKPATSLHSVFTNHFGSLPDFLTKPYASILKTFVHLSIHRGIDTIFSVRLVEDKLYSKLMVTHTSSIRQKVTDDITQKAIDNYLLEFLQNASDSSFAVQKYQQDLLSLDDEVHAIFNIDVPIQELYFEEIKGLCKHLTAQMWMDTINAVLPPEHKVSLEAKLKTRGFNATRHVFDVLDLKGDDKLRTVYLYVQLAAEVLRLDYHRRHTASSKNNIHVCLAESQKMLTRTWPYLFSSVTTAASRDSSIEALFSHVSDAVFNLNHLSWMDGDTQLRAMRVLKNITLTYFPTASRISFPSSMTYVNNTMPKTEFVADYISLLASEQAMLHRFPANGEQGRVNRLQLDGPLSYFKQLDSVVIPTAYGLAPIYYSSGAPWYFDLATVGVLIAKELSESIGPLTGSSWWTATTKASFNHTFQCLTNMYDRMSPTHNIDELELANGIFVWTRSVRLAYDLMKARYATSKEPLTAEVQQVFFKRFCLLSCSSNQDPQPLTPRQQCMLPLLNMQEFAEAYQCPQGQGANVRWCNIL